MSTLKSVLGHSCFYTNAIKDFETIISEEKTVFVSRNQKLELSINGDKGKDDKLEIFRSLLDLLFLYIGAFPQIESLDYNDEKIDVSTWSVKFQTRNDLNRSDLLICQLDKDTINQGRIDEMKWIPFFPLHSMQFLISKAYSHVVSDHKITLLLHVIEGLVDKSDNQQIKEEIKQVYNVSAGNTIGSYMADVYFVLKNYFYKYENDFNCELLSVLSTDEYKFLQTISDTRNWYSHFLQDKEKKNRLKTGREMQIYFEIIYYVLRVYCVDRIGISIEEERVKEHFYSVYDWICEITNENVENPKSKIYRINREWNEFMRLVNSYQEK